MRQVDRSSVAIPPILAQDLSVEIEKIKQGEPARPAIYRHTEVTHQLKALYLKKCFLCEMVISEEIVEHFLPWHKDFPERAYDWNNLNLSCPACNQRKRRAPYREPANPHQAAIKTVLIDPSNPPFGCQVEELLQFDKYCQAISSHQYPTAPEVINTLKFLNDSLPLGSRNRRWTELAEVIIQCDCKAIWWELSGMNDINPYQWDKINPVEKEKKILALDCADRIYQMFLAPKASYSACMKYVIFEILRLSVTDFKRMSDTYRNYKNLPVVL